MTELRIVIEQVAASFDGAGLVFGHGTDNAWDEAVALALGVTGLPDDRSALGSVVGASELERIRTLAARRINERVPLPYLLETAYFAGLPFHIEAGVVIPRSPIAELVHRQFLPWWQPLGAAPVIVDVCTGCGCIGIACAMAFTDAEVLLVDIESKALALARHNVTRHGLDDRVRVIESDLLSAVAGPVDLIVSNPPYVNAADMANLPPEYQHEPVLGLAGGDDGLDLVARLLRQAAERLSESGLLVCEVGASAGGLVRRMPELPLLWPTLSQGGEGVFVATATDLRASGRSSRRLPHETLP